MKRSAYKRRIAVGALLVAYMSASSNAFLTCERQKRLFVLGMTAIDLFGRFTLVT